MPTWNKPGRRHTVAALAAVLLVTALGLAGCQTQPVASPPGAPRLVLFLVVDQFRYDYLVRFRPVFTGGLAKLLAESVSFTDTHHDHGVTTTSPGHATLATGQFPAHHGIVDNYWYDRQEEERVYAVGDERTDRSPNRLLASTLSDWIKDANPQAKVFGVSGKDRGAILPAGHRATAALWYDHKNGGFRTSRFYPLGKPQWLSDFNHRHLADRLLGQAWEPLPLPPGAPAPAALGVEELDRGAFPNGFPHVYGDVGLTFGPDEDFYDALADTPFLDEITGEVAKALITGESLGQDDVTDFLSVSFSAVDIVGHGFGPNSPEELDTQLRLDRVLGDFLAFVDQKIGLDHVVISLSADHGVVPLPEYQKLHGLPGERIDAAGRACLQQLESKLEGKLGTTGAPWITPDGNLPPSVLKEDSTTSRHDVEEAIRGFVEACPGVAHAWLRSDFESGRADADPAGRLYHHSFFLGRSPDLYVQFQEGFLALASSGTTHGTPYAYDTHVPWLLRLPGGHAREIGETVHTVDIAPTLAALAKISVPVNLDGVDRSAMVRGQ